MRVCSGFHEKVYGSGVKRWESVRECEDFDEEDETPPRLEPNEGLLRIVRAAPLVFPTYEAFVMNLYIFGEI